LSVLGQSRAAPRSRARFSLSVAVISTLSTLAMSAMSLSGCRNKQEEARQKAELTKALAEFKTQMGELQKQASGLRARFDKLPEDLPGIETVRDDLHAVEEGLGVEDGRAKWLAGELDKAFASGKKQEIEAVGKAIPQGDGGIAEVIVRVAHKLPPLEGLAAQRRYFESLDAARARDAQKERPRNAR
jgi:hypothetical protein